MKLVRSSLVAALCAAMIALPASPALAKAPRLGKGGASTNWCGYAALTSLTAPDEGSVSDVKGTWTVPSVTGSSNAYSSAWVGIDGYDSKTVEQIGTESDWVGGGARYYAWWEMFPKMSRLIPNVTVQPRDQISAEVRWLNKRVFQLSMVNVTTGETFSTLQRRGNADQSSAEWIVEAPSLGGTLPLAQFTPTTFTDCEATINGHTGGINDSHWVDDGIDLVNFSGTVIASPSSLTAGGTSFTVTRD